MTATSLAPTRRVVLLGASNLTRGLHTALEVLKQGHEVPFDVLAALGNGRSYGLYSRILGRGLTGILDCGLWNDLASRNRLPTAALVTDIGNDVMYGVPAPTILAWVEECLRRLKEYDARIVVTGLPTANLPRLGPRRFIALRTLFFPRNRDSLATVTERSRTVDEGVRALADRYGAAWIEPCSDWYGFDPIHFRLRFWPAAWQLYLEGLAAVSEELPADRPSPPAVSLWRSLRTHFLVPHERRFLGLTQRASQPCWIMPDGTQVSLY